MLIFKITLDKERIHYTKIHFPFYFTVEREMKQLVEIPTQKAAIVAAAQSFKDVRVNIHNRCIHYTKMATGEVGRRQERM